MGVLHIAHTCSHLQNAARARLGLTSLPNVKFNLDLSLALHRSGFLSSVTRAGPRPPSPEELLTFEPEPVTTANVATRRLWVGLKYWNNEPVLKKMRAVSRPSRDIWMDRYQLGRIARGFDAGYVDGLGMGECLFVSTDRGVLEVREALDRRVGGLVLCRVS